MMKKIGLFEAKTHLSKIAERVRRTGESVTLTKRGLPFVDLVPHQEAEVTRRPQAQVIADLNKLRQKLPKGSFDQIKADIDAGRR